MDDRLVLSATKGNAIAVLQLLKKRRARIDAKDKLGNIALALALGQGNPDSVKLLPEKGAQ